MALTYLRVGVVQAAAGIGRGAVATNLATAGELIADAARDGAKLVLLPEAFLQGYNYDAVRNVWPHVDMIGEHSEPDSKVAPAAAGLVNLAAKHGVHIGTTIFTRSGTDVFNTFVLAGPDGLHPRRHSKAEPAIFENFLFRGGRDRATGNLREGPRVFDTPIGRIGISICFETYSPQTWMELAAGGAQLILAPHCAMVPGQTLMISQKFVREWGRVLSTGPDALANVLGVPMAFTNHTGPYTSDMPFLWYRGAPSQLFGPGTHLPGEARIINHTGKSIARLGNASGYTVATVQLGSGVPHMRSHAADLHQHPARKGELLDHYFTPGEQAKLRHHLTFPIEGRISHAVNGFFGRFWYEGMAKERRAALNRHI